MSVDADVPASDHWLTGRSESLTARLLWALTGLVALLIFLPTLDYGFVFDDTLLIVRNRELTESSLASLFGRFHWQEFGHGNYYRPVILVSYALWKRLFGVSRFAWHGAAVALHVVVTLMIYPLARRLGLSRIAALSAAAVFAAHPVHIEAVAWIAGANATQNAVPFVGAVLCALAAADAGSTVRRRGLFAASLALTCLALLSKETAAVLPALIPIMVIVARRARELEPRPLRRELLSLAGLALPYGLCLGLYLILRVLVLGGLSHKASPLGLGDVLASAPKALLGHLGLLALPVRRFLFYDYGPASLQSAGWLIPALAVVGLVLVAARAVRRRSAVLGALAWLLLPLLPLLDLRNLPNREVLHDRFLYLPSVGFVLLVGMAVDRTESGAGRERELGRRSLLGLAAVVLVLTGLTWRDLPAWRSDATLWRHAAVGHPSHPTVLTNLSRVQLAEGDLNGARSSLQRLVRGFPASVEGHFNLGLVELRAGRLAAAERALREAIRLTGGRDAASLFQLARVLQQRGKHEAAIAAADRGLALRPRARGARVLVAESLRALNRELEARRWLEEELQLFPGDPAARRALVSLDERAR